MKKPAGRFALLPRAGDTSKRDYGHTLVLAGSRPYSGAAILAVLGAMRSGSGLVTAAVPKGLWPVVSRAVWEAIKLEMPENRSGGLARGAAETLRQYGAARRLTCLAVGPGLGPGKDTAACVRLAVRRAEIPVVLDADGLRAFRGRAQELAAVRAPLIVTPHDFEFASLFGKRPPRETTGRAALAKKTAAIYDLVLVLKGSRTVVTDGRRLFVNATGNPGMAKGGSGDVLTGIIASFVSQGMEPYLAAAWAVYFHGRAGDLAVRKRGELGLLARDLLECLPQALLRP